MNQQAQAIPSTQVKRTRTKRNNEFRGNRLQFLTVKGSSIPLSIQEYDTKEGVVKWGKKNEYPYYLNYLVKSNPIHGGIINAKITFTTSGGLIYEGSNQAGYESFYSNKKLDHKDKNLEKIVSDLSRSFEVSNLACVKIYFNQMGERTYRKMEVIPFEQIRFGAFENGGEIFLDDTIKVSKDWIGTKASRETLRPYNAINDEDRVCYAMMMIETGQGLDDPTKIRELNPSIYPEPTYAGGLTAIDTGIQVNQYLNSEIHNGFSLGTLIYLAGGDIQDANEKKKFEQDLGSSTTGSNQAGRSMVIYGRGQEQKPSIEALNGNNLPDRYTNVKAGSESSIVHAHSLTTPILAGIKTEGSMGNATELEIGYQIFKQNYITARQDELISFLNWIMNDIAGVEGSLKFGEVVLNLEGEVAVDESSQAGKSLNEMSPLVATKVLSAMTQNEIRNLAKLMPIEGGDELPQPANTAPTAAFSKTDTDIILNRLKAHGQDRNKFTVLHSLSLDGGELDKDALVSDYRKSFAELTDTAITVLGLINSDEGYDSIRSVLDLSTSDLNAIYNDLESEGYIGADGNITTSGKRAAAVAEVESISVMYSYELRPDAPRLVAGGKSRPFCTELITLGRLYSRDDINTISGIEGYNVFAYRGGWYHNPNTDNNEPGCRHEWRQVIVFNN